MRAMGLLSAAHRLIEIGDDVLDILEADRQAHDVRPGACLDQLFRGKLAVGRTGTGRQ